MASMNYSLVNNQTMFINWDVDGVILKFMKGADWHQPNYWLYLEAIKKTVSCIKILRSKETELNIKNQILSCSPSAEASNDKMTNLGRQGLQDVYTIIVPDGVNKSNFVNEKNAILVDDFHRNLMEWQGYPVKFYNDVNNGKFRMDGTQKNNYFFSISEKWTAEEMAEHLLSVIELIRNRPPRVPIPMIRDGNGKIIMYR